MCRNPSVGTVLRIWVDSAQSMVGGRELWYIPKELAEFRFDHGAGFSAAMRIDGREVVSYRYTPRWTVPGRWPTRVVTVGAGIHLCLGAALGSAELTVALRQIAERFPRIALSGPLQWRPSIAVRTLLQAPVVLDGAATGS
jgi:hypothetical protein